MSKHLPPQLAETARGPDGSAQPPGSPHASRTGTAVRWIALLGFPASLASPGAVISMVLVALYGFFMLLREGGLDPDLRRAHRYMLTCYLLVLAVEFLNGGFLDNLSTGFNFLPLLAIVPYAHALRRIEMPPRALEHAMAATIAVAALMSIYRVGVLGEDRPGGLQVASVGYGVILAIWATFLFSRAFEQRGRAAAMSFATVAVACVPVFLAESKIGLICMIVGPLAVALLWAHESGRWLSVIAGAFAVGMPLAAAGYLTIFPRLVAFWEDVGDLLHNGMAMGSSFGLRHELNVAGWRAFLEKPWFGYGFEERMAAVMAHTSPDGPNVKFVPYVHNEYVTHLVAIGVFGLVFLAMFLVSIVILARRASDPALRRAGIALVALLAVYMLADVVFNLDPMISAVVMALGVVLAGRPQAADAPASRA